MTVRWYVRYGLSYRDVEELLAERSIEMDHVTEADRGRLKARLRPMRWIKTIRSLRVVAARHAFAQNLCRGHYELTTELPAHDRLRVAFAELAVRL